MPSKRHEPEDEPEKDERAPGAGTQGRAGLANMLRRDMVRNEQLAVYGAGLLALLIGIAISTPLLLQHHRTQSAGSPLIYLLVTIGVFIALSAAARYGRRTVASVASLLAAFGMGTIIGFIYIVLGAWLLFRSSRAQRLEREASRRSPAGGGSRATGRSTATARSPRAGRGRRAKREAGDEGPTLRRARPNKRYTPPAAKGRKR